MIACFNNHLNIVKYLIENKNNPYKNIGLSNKVRHYKTLLDILFMFELIGWQ